MLVSVYPPTQNRLALLQRAVASVLAQAHTEPERITADDGSTDGTAPRLEQLAAQDSRVRWLRHTQSLGVPAARNRAIQQARGARLDTAGTRDSGLLSTERIEGARGSYALRKPPTVSVESLFRHNQIGNQIFARRSTCLEAGLCDEAMPAWQDLDLFLRMVQRCGPAHLLPHCTDVLADDAPADRISRKHKSRLLEAHARIAAKWPDLPAVHKQRLYLQRLAPFDGFVLEWADVRRYFAYGLSPAACARLARAVARRLGSWMRTRSLRSLRMEEVFP